MPKSKKRKKPSPQPKQPRPSQKPIVPDRYQQCVNEGVEHFYAGDFVSAENKFREAIDINPGVSVAHSLLGVIAMNSGVLDIAEACFRQAISIDPGVADYHYNLSLALQQGEKLDEARTAVQTALDLKPDYALAWNTLGHVLLKIGDFHGSVEALNRAIAYQSDLGEAWVNLCGAHQELNNHKQAQEAGRRGCELCPDIQYSHYNLARAYDGECKWEEALDAYEKALAIQPDFAKAHINISRCLTKSGESLRGEESARRAVELVPEDAEAHNNLGTALLDQGRYAESIQAFNRSVELDATAPEAHNNLGHALLTMENFAQGWKEYEAGFQTGDRGPLTVTPAPVWNGEALAGKRIHVYGEQGIGEQIMFATMLQDVRDAGADVIYECEERLVPIFKRSMPWLTVVPLTDKPEQPHPDLLDPGIDYRVSAGSLGQWFRQDVTDFTPRSNMLTPDPELSREYRDRYRSSTDDIVVGISWKSNSPNHADRKNIPIELWRPILTVPGCRFISLQYGDVEEDVRQARDTLGVDIHVDQEVSALNSLEQSCAQAAAIDLVISISNATVHCSAACGVPTWMLIGVYPLWHWFLNRPESLWYEDLRMFRQEKLGEWLPLTTTVGQELQAFVRSRK